ncbi:hypothetical protein D9M72_205530 [compost metagenome]
MGPFGPHRKPLPPGVSLTLYIAWLSARMSAPCLAGSTARRSAESRSAPAVSCRLQLVAPCPSIGATAQLRPCTPSTSGRRLTAASFGSCTSVSDGITAPRASAMVPSAFIATGRRTPLGHTIACTLASARSAVPAPSFMPLSSTTASPSTVPAFRRTLPSAL